MCIRTRRQCKGPQQQAKLVSRGEKAEGGGAGRGGRGGGSDAGGGPQIDIQEPMPVRGGPKQALGGGGGGGGRGGRGCLLSSRRGPRRLNRPGGAGWLPPRPRTNANTWEPPLGAGSDGRTGRPAVIQYMSSALGIPCPCSACASVVSGGLRIHCQRVVWRYQNPAVQGAVVSLEVAI
jgi:hypothetical protein